MGGEMKSMWARNQQFIAYRLLFNMKLFAIYLAATENFIFKLFVS